MITNPRSQTPVWVCLCAKLGLAIRQAEIDGRHSQVELGNENNLFYSCVGWVGAMRKPIIEAISDGFLLRFNPSYAQTCYIFTTGVSYGFKKSHKKLFIPPNT